MTGELCARCERVRAAVRVQCGEEPSRMLCAFCLRKMLAEWGGPRHADVARFLSLFMPARRRPARLVPDLPAETRCGGCGLRYDEFAARGLAGCEECYRVFAAAILPALEMLQGAEVAEE